MITALTQKQKSAMASHRDKWINIGLCTDPADRPAAEAAIRLMYEGGGKAPPERIVWTTSPLAQGLTRALVLGLDKRVGASVVASVGASVVDSVGA